MESDKREIQKQWDTDPCGANTAIERRDTADYYAAIRKYRYAGYGPWFDSTVGLSNYKDLDVLEIGVGLGSDHFTLAANGNRMTAVDLSTVHLEHTRKHLAFHKLSTKAVNADAEYMPFENESFDLVYAFGVLHHTPDIAKSLAEIHRILRPGGTILVGLYNRNSWFFWIQTIMVAGILKLGLIRKGWRWLMSEIEYRQDQGSATPLVRVYSRRDVAGLLKKFNSVAIQTCHIEPIHFWRLQNLARRLTRSELERTFGRGGWYVIAKATK